MSISVSQLIEMELRASGPRSLGDLKRAALTQVVGVTPRNVNEKVGEAIATMVTTEQIQQVEVLVYEWKY